MNFKFPATLALAALLAFAVIWIQQSNSQLRSPPDIASSPLQPTSQPDLPFDFYVLALSWSPTFCQNSNSNSHRLQCGTSKKYGFIVHGLWPQFERTGWPEFCKTTSSLSAKLINAMLDLMPSKSLVSHQWEKHGSCSGLSPRDYFETVRAARDQFKMPFPVTEGKPRVNLAPREIIASFRATNTALLSNSLVVTCDETRLKEVRICLDKNLTPRKCGPSVGNQCRNNTVRMPPIR